MLYDAVNQVRADPNSLGASFANGKKGLGPLHWSNGLSMACRDIVYKNGPQGITCDDHTSLFDMKKPDDRAKNYATVSSPVTEALICGSLKDEDSFKDTDAYDELK